jgi:thiol:disulfide interchange protein DsbD
MFQVLTLVALVLSPLQRPTDVVRWSAEAASATAADRATVSIKVSAQVQPGWKLYAIEQPPGGPKPLSFATAKGSPFQIVSKRIVAPPSKLQKQDENFALDTRYYENSAAFAVPVTVASEVAAGTHEIPLEVTFQACGAELCLRPFTLKLPVRISIAR